MRKIILFYITSFLLVNKTYAIPFLGVVPFAFDLSLFIMFYFFGLINLLFFYLIKKLDIITIITLFLNIFLIIYLKTNIGLNSFIDINLNLGVFVKYLYLLILFIFTCLVLYIYRLKIIYLFLISLLFLFINCNLVYDTITLKIKYNHIVDELIKNEDIEFISDLTHNNIIISRDFILYGDFDKYKCRLSLSYYFSDSVITEKRISGKRGSEIILYTAILLNKNILNYPVDNKCRRILSKYYY